jgi:preprotein translocase subunit SecG
MNTIQTVVLIGHTVIALLIIILVLVQRGKGADAGAAFGSGASGTVFGARGSSNFFSRATAILATAFFASSLTLAYISSQHGGAPDSLIEGAPALAPAEAEAETDAMPELPEFPELGDEAPAADAEEIPALEPQPDDNGAEQSE